MTDTRWTLQIRTLVDIGGGSSTISGTTFVFSMMVDPTWTIEKLKDEIKNITGVRPDRESDVQRGQNTGTISGRIIFVGRGLEDDEVIKELRNMESISIIYWFNKNLLDNLDAKQIRTKLDVMREKGAIIDQNVFEKVINFATMKETAINYNLSGTNTSRGSGASASQKKN